MRISEAQWTDLQGDRKFCDDLAAYYRSARRNLGLTQAALSDEASVHPKSVQRLEQGHLSEVSVEMARRLSSAIGKSLEEMCGAVRAGTLSPSLSPPRAELPHLRFLEGQRAAILNEPLLPWVTDNRVSLRFLWPDLLVPAPMTLQRQQGEARAHSVADLSDLDRAAYIGPPGIGKTTTLRRVALELTTRYLNFEARDFPILAHARDYAGWFHGEDARVLRLKLPPTARLAILVDGLDEVGQAVRQSIVDDAADRFGTPQLIILGCRSDAFAEVIAEGGASSVFDEIFELIPWSYDRHVLLFAEAYFSKVNDELGLKAFKDACENIKKLKDFVSNPFHLSLTLYLIQAGRKLSDNLFIDRYTLYHEFYANWLTRERRRGTSSLRARQIEAIHLDIARQLYEARIDGRPGPHLPDAGAHAPFIFDTAFRGLFEWRFDPFEERDLISNFRHETLQEFLLARGVLHDLVEGGAVGPALETQYNNDVNSFVRQGLSNLGLPARRTIASRLAGLLDGHSAPPLSLAVREQAIYYLGRLELDQCPDVLVHLAENDPHPIARRSAALGAILYGHEEIETAYIEKILGNPAADTLNRSIQLAYFGDAQGTIFDFVDDGQCPWTNTKAAIMERLSGCSDRDIRLRLWDLATLYSFLRSRPFDLLESSEAEAVRRSLANATFFSEGRSKQGSMLVRQIDGLNNLRRDLSANPS